MKRAICLAIVLGFVPLTVRAGDEKVEGKKGAELTDPVEILKKTDAACKALKTVKYDVALEGTGASAARFPKTEATVILSGFAFRAPERYFADVKMAQPGSTEVRHVTGGSDGEMFYVIDHREKKAYEDIDPQVVGSLGRIVAAGFVVEFIYDEPFRDEINGKSHELRGSKTINGEDCYEIYLEYNTPQAQNVIWYISKKDFLPRGRIDDITYANGGRLTQQKMISNLVAEPKLDKSAFALKLPEGYTKTDDFAP